MASTPTDSVWTATVKLPSYTPLTADTSADVCVVGAGIAGLTTAYLLAQVGKSVVVIDDGAIGSGMTSVTTAHLVNALDDRFFELERMHGERGSRLAAESHSSAIDQVEQIVARERIACDFRRLDGYLLLAPEHDEAFLDRELDAAHRAGLFNVAKIGRAPIAYETGPCLRFPNQAQFHPLKYLAGLAGALARGGGRMYLNRKSRWNWGLVAEHLPYVTGAYSQGLATVDGQQTIVQEQVRVTQLNSGASAIAQYPFSKVQRAEFSAGVRRIGFDAQVETQFFSAITGELFGEQKTELDRPDALHLGEATAALVYDSSIFGATSPLVGRRYRFEYSQMGGSLTYGGVLADVRQYFMPVRPFTFAVRGLHYGRYGADSEDGRLTPLFLGYQGLVRGYDFGSFDANECESVDLNSCEASTG